MAGAGDRERLDPGGVCHVGYVDGRANPDANALARKVADKKTRAFRCGKDVPDSHGKTGPVNPHVC